MLMYLQYMCFKNQQTHYFFILCNVLFGFQQSQLIPGSVLDPNMDEANGRTGTWTEDEDLKLEDAVQTHGGKNWKKIAALVPGRTNKQCCARWHNALDPSIALTAGSTGTFTEDEDLKLEAAVQTHGGKNWKKIAAMVPGRTKKQCSTRWYYALEPSIAQTPGRTGAFTEDEDHKLEAAVQTRGGKNWKKIAAMVPGRTKKQVRADSGSTPNGSFSGLPGNSLEKGFMMKV
jgi:hypothetical protein